MNPGTDRTEHTFRGSGPVHSWTCPPCVEAANERNDRALRDNPHRPGTKVHAEYLRNNGNGPHIDPRFEHYWSM